MRPFLLVHSYKIQVKHILCCLAVIYKSVPHMAGSRHTRITGTYTRLPSSKPTSNYLHICVRCSRDMSTQHQAGCSTGACYSGTPGEKCQHLCCCATASSHVTRYAGGVTDFTQTTVIISMFISVDYYRQLYTWD